SKGQKYKIMKSGHVGKIKEDYLPSMVPQMVSFNAQGEIVLIIEVANFHWARGGLWQTPVFGSDLKVYEKRSAEKNQNFFIFGCILIISLYSLILYLISKKDKAPLYFGIFGIMVVMMLTIRLGYFYDLFPALDPTLTIFKINIKIWYLNLAAVALSFLAFYATLFDPLFRNYRFFHRLDILKKLAFVGILAYSIVILLTSAKTNTAITIYFYIFVGVIFIWVFYALIWVAMFLKSKAAWLSLLGLAIFFLSTINDILYSRKIVLTANTQQFSYFLFIIQAYVLLRENNKARVKAEARTSSLLKHSPDIVLDIDNDYKLLYLNKALESPVTVPLKSTVNSLIGKTIFDLLPKDIHDTIRPHLRKLFSTGGADMAEVKTTLNQKEHWLEFRFATIGHYEFINEAIIIITDITKKKNMERELADTQNELVKEAHKAGMAEIASDTLHNIGNVLNNIKTSAHLIKESVLKSPMKKYSSTCDLIREKRDNMEQFLLATPGGNQLFDYLLILEEKFKDSFEQIENNIDRQDQKIKTITEVIRNQQKYVGIASFKENLNLTDIIENSLAMVSDLTESSEITIEKQYDITPEINLPKTKLHYTLVNLFNNAAHALTHSDVSPKILKISLKLKNNKAVLIISDNGYGIKKENLDKIFNHGFTTNKESSGFGLHSCANYLSEMGAEIEAFSDGLGKGATFEIRFNEMG
ncbi:PAS domain-containing protein, partial [bacterium]|nr:PAS domain-containing protein [bacterium]